jgi:hypothetical protein
LQAAGSSGLLTTLTVPGTWSYTPAAGTVLATGNHILTATFTPTNIGTKYTNYAIATASVPISVVEAPSITLTTTATLTKTSGGYQAWVTVTNSGSLVANNVTLTMAMLGSVAGATLPHSFGTIAASGGSASFAVTFPSSAGIDGASVVEKLGGVYTGGSFSSSIRAVLP